MSRAILAAILLVSSAAAQEKTAGESMKNVHVLRDVPVSERDETMSFMGNALTERRRKPLRRATLQRLFEIYAGRFADPDGRIRATFEIVWLSGWAPHESQQKPLTPGSARQRLADALGVEEKRIGRSE